MQNGLEEFDVHSSPESPSFPTSEGISSRSSSDSVEEGEQDNQQRSRIAETNSGDGSRSCSQNPDGNGTFEHFGSSASQFPRHSPTNDGSPSHEEDQPMDMSRGDASPYTDSDEGDRHMDINRGDTSRISELSDEEMDQSIDWVQPLYFDGAVQPSNMVKNSLSPRALAFTYDLLCLIPSPSDDPPGRLPVSIASPELFVPPLKISLKSMTAKPVASSTKSGEEIPSKYRTENDRNRGLPSMEVSEESIRRGFDQACVHFAFFATKLMALMSNDKTLTKGTDSEETDSKDTDSKKTDSKKTDPEDDYAAAFELFQEEFRSFDEMVTFALKRLGALVRPEVIETLNERHRDVKNKFSKLEFAAFNGRMYHQGSYISRVSTDIQGVQRSLWEIYA